MVNFLLKSSLISSVRKLHETAAVSNEWKGAAASCFLADEEGHVDFSNDVDTEVRVEAEAGDNVIDAHHVAEASGEGEPALRKGHAGQAEFLGREEGREDVDASEKGDVVPRSGGQPSGGKDRLEARGAGGAGFVGEDGHEALALVEGVVADLDAVEGGVDGVVEDVIQRGAEDAALEGLGDGGVDGVLEVLPDVEAECLQDVEDDVVEPAAAAVDADVGSVDPLRTGGRSDTDRVGGVVQREVHGAQDFNVVGIDGNRPAAVKERDCKTAAAEAGTKVERPLDGPRGRDVEVDVGEPPVELAGVDRLELADVDVKFVDADAGDRALTARSRKTEGVVADVEVRGDLANLRHDDDVEQVLEEFRGKGERDANWSGVGSVETARSLLRLLLALEEFVANGFGLRFEVFIEELGVLVLEVVLVGAGVALLIVATMRLSLFTTTVFGVFVRMVNFVFEGRARNQDDDDEEQQCSNVHELGHFFFLRLVIVSVRTVFF